MSSVKVKYLANVECRLQNISVQCRVEINTIWAFIVAIYDVQLHCTMGKNGRSTFLWFTGGCRAGVGLFYECHVSGSFKGHVGLKIWTVSGVRKNPFMGATDQYCSEA